MWAENSVFYQIYPLGFCGAPKENDGVTVNRIGKIADWAKTALAQMAQQKIISGSKGKLNPTGKVTRAEVAKMLYMLSEL